MRLIINARDGATAEDLLSLAKMADFALRNGLGEKVGTVMLVTPGTDYSRTAAVKRTKTGVSVFAPDAPA